MRFKGLTLIEVLVASLLLVIVVSASLVGMVQNQKIVLQNGQYFVAEKIINQFFEHASVANTRAAIIDEYESTVYGLHRYQGEPNNDPSDLLAHRITDNLGLLDVSENYYLYFLYETVDLVTPYRTTTVLKVSATVCWDVESGVENAQKLQYSTIVK